MATLALPNPLADRVRSLAQFRKLLIGANMVVARGTLRRLAQGA